MASDMLNPLAPKSQTNKQITLSPCLAHNNYCTPVSFKIYITIIITITITISSCDICWL